LTATIIRLAKHSMSAALKLLVEFIEHNVTQQGRKRTSLRGPFHARADQPILHHPSIQECPDEFQEPLVLEALGDLAHQLVVIDPIEEFLQIKISHPAIALRNVLLRLRYGLMRRPTRSKSIAVMGERRVPL